MLMVKYKSSSGYRKAKEISKESFTKGSVLELEYITRMIKRTDKIVRPSFIELSNDVSDTDSFKIATISLDIKKGDIDTYTKVCHHVDYTLHNIKNSSYSKIKSTLLKKIEIACKEGVHFICVNELGYPMCRNMQGFKKENTKLQKELKQLANKYNTYIIPGTFHSPTTLHNLAYIFYPTVGGVAGPKIHAKKTSAFTVDEKIIVPYNRDIRFYKTLYGSIGLMICLDSYDPSLIVGLVRENDRSQFDKNGVDIIFVPSFNGDVERARTACEDLSFFLSNIVVLVNSKVYGGDSNTVFLCGKLIKHYKSISQGVNIFKILKSNYEATKHSLVNERIQLFRTIFGITTAISTEF